MSFNQPHQTQHPPPPHPPPPPPPYLICLPLPSSSSSSSSMSIVFFSYCFHILLLPQHACTHKHMHVTQTYEQNVHTMTTKPVLLLLHPHTNIMKYITYSTQALYIHVRTSSLEIHTCTRHCAQFTGKTPPVLCDGQFIMVY